MSAKKTTAVKKATTPKKTTKAKAPAVAPWSIADALADERLQTSVRRALGNQNRFRTPRRVALETLGYGLDEGAADDRAIHSPHENLGWAKLKKAGEGDESISVRASDTLFDGMQIDVLKMDVEGMEIGALKGLKATIVRYKPTMFIEVDKGNLDAFHALMEDYGYEIAHAYKVTRVNQNFLLKPNSD